MSNNPVQNFRVFLGNENPLTPTQAAVLQELMGIRMPPLLLSPEELATSLQTPISPAAHLPKKNTTGRTAFLAVMALLVGFASSELRHQHKQPDNLLAASALPSTVSRPNPPPIEVYVTPTAASTCQVTPRTVATIEKKHSKRRHRPHHPTPTVALPTIEQAAPENQVALIPSED